ncbi:MAG: hypothetical protein ABEI80_06510 [Haloplanus sp.]
MNYLTRRRIAVGGALLGVGFAAGYGYAPGLVPTAVRAPVASVRDAVDPQLALVLVGAAVGVLALLYAWVTRPPSTTPMADPAREASDRNAAVAGRDLTTHYERMVDGEGSSATDPNAHPEGDPLRRRLRAVVVDAHRHARRPEDATTYVDRGRWTDDRYAAAFLSATAAVDYPWYHRLYAWLYPERAYERRVGRALRAAERACAEQLPGYDAPATEPDGRLRRLRRALEGSA